MDITPELLTGPATALGGISLIVLALLGAIALFVALFRTGAKATPPSPCIRFLKTGAFVAGLPTVILLIMTPVHMAKGTLRALADPQLLPPSTGLQALSLGILLLATAVVAASPASLATETKNDGLEWAFGISLIPLIGFSAMAQVIAGGLWFLAPLGIFSLILLMGCIRAPRRSPPAEGDPAESRGQTPSS